VLALIANVACLFLIKQHREGDVHMRASWIFSDNDVIANLGVILSGVLVWWLGNRWPDLIVGLIIATVILRGSVMIYKDARKGLAEDECSGGSCSSESCSGED